MNSVSPNHRFVYFLPNHTRGYSGKLPQEDTVARLLTRSSAGIQLFLFSFVIALRGHFLYNTLYNKFSPLVKGCSAIPDDPS